MHTTEDVIPCLCYILCSQKWFCTSSFFLLIASWKPLDLQWSRGFQALYDISNWFKLGPFSFRKINVCLMAYITCCILSIFFIQYNCILCWLDSCFAWERCLSLVVIYLTWYRCGIRITTMPSFFQLIFLQSDRRIPKHPCSKEQAVRVLSYLHENNLVHIMWKIVNSFLRWVAI